MYLAREGFTVDVSATLVIAHDTGHAMPNALRLQIVVQLSHGVMA